MHLFFYLDPGSGSLLLQLILAAILGIGMAVRIFWKRIRALFTGRQPTPPEDVDQDDQL